MASSSETDRIVRRSAAAGLDYRDFIDAALAREAIENARHLLDSHGQVLACWVAETTGTMDVLYDIASGASERPFPVLELGPFPLRVRPDGWSHGLVVDLLVSQGKTNTITWGAQIETAEPGTSTDGVTMSTTGTRSNAWAATKSTMAAEWLTSTTSLHLDPTQVRAALRRLEVPAVEGAADRASTDVVLAWVRIVVSSASGSDDPVLRGYRIREFDTADWP